MIKYNICFISRGDEILLLNRQFEPWMGCWNGIGGKLDNNELPRNSMRREIYEETNIQEYTLHFKGVVTWVVDEKIVGGMYLYLAEVSEQYVYDTPIKTVEGILDWKPTTWIMDKNNVGIAANIPESLELILNDPLCYQHQCKYKDGKLIEHTSIVIDPLIETNEGIREAFLAKYLISN
ncbi:8-oxo-dGTP diphosphatase [Paenibacillus sp. N3/727]|uniref:NUDIX hydrolase n=1 Tax=Paenibacillus sp. N3/727 TaxID=2925845 RepID=UPI001F53597F|nr:8-oxo-dGTP diphosphatase [Paenibacillus sp. N3/727]UNK16961.1 8-oxo-dGTP diphosphatase [Paenibacillus sp. N3/727]